MQEEKKILIVDDDVDVVFVVKSILKPLGYKVISACCKEDALHKMIYEEPVLAILDVMMTSYYEGLELALEMHEHPKLKNIPFLFQTSLDIVSTTKANIKSLAHAYRKDPDFRNLNVLMVNNVFDGTAAIDYRTLQGEHFFFPVGGFLRKPIDADLLVLEVEKLLKDNNNIKAEVSEKIDHF